MRTQLISGAILSLALASCGAVTPDNRVPCASQDTCDKEFHKVCEAGYCSAQLPPNSEHLEFLVMGLDTSVQLATPRAFRAAVIYATTPDGKTVVCPGTAPGANEVSFTKMADLGDRTKFNLSASLIETNGNFASQTVRGGVFVNGPGRIVYVEMYGDLVQQGKPETGGPPIGVGCVTDAPYADKASDATVNVQIKPPKQGSP